MTPILPASCRVTCGDSAAKAELLTRAAAGRHSVRSTLCGAMRQSYPPYRGCSILLARIAAEHRKMEASP